MINMKKLLVELHCPAGRMGTLYGLFICTEEELQKATGKSTWYYDVLGKHSDLEYVCDDLVIRSEDQQLIEQLEKTFNSRTLSGLNPVAKILEEMD